MTTQPPTTHTVRLADDELLSFRPDAEPAGAAIELLTASLYLDDGGQAAEHPTRSYTGLGADAHGVTVATFDYLRLDRAGTPVDSARCPLPRWIEHYERYLAADASQGADGDVVLLLGPLFAASRWRGIEALLLAAAAQHLGATRLVAHECLVAAANPDTAPSVALTEAGFSSWCSDSGLYVADLHDAKAAARQQQLIDGHTQPTTPPPPPEVPTVTVQSLHNGPIEIADYAALFPLCPDHGHRSPATMEDACESCDDFVDQPCEICEWCERCEARTLTPRAAFHLSSALEIMGDTLTHAMATTAPSAATAPDAYADFWEDLPPVAFRDMTRAWASRFTLCFKDLAARINRGELPLPRSTGEEMALHMALDYSIDAESDGSHAETFESWYEGFPEVPDLDCDFERLRTLLFEDHDVLMLLDAELEAIADGGPVAEFLGVANLHPDEWFVPFRSFEGTLRRLGR